MEIFEAGIDLLQGIVTLVGGVMTVFGIIQLLLGFHEQNGVQKMQGATLAICGAGVAAAGIKLVPMLKGSAILFTEVIIRLMC